jgi:hypothetical protein
MRLLGIPLISGLLVLTAAEKKPPVAQAGNDQLQITATLYPDKEAVRQELGNDLGGYFIVMKVELLPKGGKALAVSRDDFLLRSFKDGQKSGPFEPSQIAGRGALVVSTTSTGGGSMSQDRGPVWGGIPGTGGRPQRLPGDRLPGGETSGGGTAPGQTGADSRVDSGDKTKDDPLLTELKTKILPEKETSEPLAGLLYFSLEGKHKPKDLQLQYRGAAGKLVLQFR